MLLLAFSNFVTMMPSVINEITDTQQMLKQITELKNKLIEAIFDFGKQKMGRKMCHRSVSSVWQHKFKVRSFIKSEEIDVFLISETHQTSHHNWHINKLRFLLDKQS